MNHNVTSLSPRRVKPAPTIVLYELRLLRVSARPASMLPLFEARTKKWRGVLRWALHAFSSSRAELVLQVIVERQAVARVDNLFATWRRTLTKVMGKAFDLRKLKRAEWLHVGASDTSGSVMADVRVLFDAFDSGCAKLWADSHDPAAVRCSYLEPALPAAAMVEKAARPLVVQGPEAVCTGTASGAGSGDCSSGPLGRVEGGARTKDGGYQLGSMKQPLQPLGLGGATSVYPSVPTSAPPPLQRARAPPSSSTAYGVVQRADAATAESDRPPPAIIVSLSR